MKYLLGLLASLLLMACPKDPTGLKVYVEAPTGQTSYALENAGRLFGVDDFLIVTAASSADVAVRIAPTELPEVQPEGYQRRWNAERETAEIIAKDANGAMYALLDLAEQEALYPGDRSWLKTGKTVSPPLPNRFIKFNLPWSSYRKSPALDLHEATCRDTVFWRDFLDHMAVNRFNALSLWNLHPFTDMVRLEKYPEASPYTTTEMADKQRFWTSLFRMAKTRGIETYLVNWNIFVSDEFSAAHGLAGYGSKGYIGEATTNELVEDYTRECVRQVINEYPDLTGLGLTLGERMGGMTAEERRDWVGRTILPGMAAANRKAKLLYRAPLSAGRASHGTVSRSTEQLTRSVLDTLSIPSETIISFKYNWSHGHSADQLYIVHGGQLTDTYWNPVPTNYSMLWTVRNEDFHLLRWGQPDFVRRFLKNNTDQPYVTGCILGSECYLPATDYFSNQRTGNTYRYAFQRQWLWYAVWGRLLYDPATPDAHFAAQLNHRFGIDYGGELLDTWKTASDYYHLFASFYKGTWDATAYAEAFASLIHAHNVDRKGTEIITMAALGSRPVLDTARFVNIADFVRAGRQETRGRMTPLELADLLDANAERILTDLERYHQQGQPSLALDIELTDLETLANLQAFFAARLRATLLLADHLVAGDVLDDAGIEHYLDAGIVAWERVVALKETYNKAVVPYVFDAELDYGNYLEILREERANFRTVDGFWRHKSR